MPDRRSLLRTGGAATLGTLALIAVGSGTDLAAATTTQADLFGNPAETPNARHVLPQHLTTAENRNLKTFDELDFVVYSGQEWNRMRESHAPNIRVHFADGHYTDGLDQHIEDLKTQFVWAPDTRIVDHPIRIAKENLTAVTGVVTGTFTQPMPDGNGGHVQPTGKRFAVNMVTVGIWNSRGVMDEEFLFMDSNAFTTQIGLA